MVVGFTPLCLGSCLGDNMGNGRVKKCPLPNAKILTPMLLDYGKKTASFQVVEVSSVRKLKSAGYLQPSKAFWPAHRALWHYSYMQLAPAFLFALLPPPHTSFLLLGEVTVGLWHFCGEPSWETERERERDPHLQIFYKYMKICKVQSVCVCVCSNWPALVHHKSKIGRCPIGPGQWKSGDPSGKVLEMCRGCVHHLDKNRVKGPFTRTSG